MLIGATLNTKNMMIPNYSINSKEEKATSSLPESDPSEPMDLATCILDTIEEVAQESLMLIETNPDSEKPSLKRKLIRNDSNPDCSTDKKIKSCASNYSFLGDIIRIIPAILDFLEVESLLRFGQVCLLAHKQQEVLMINRAKFYGFTGNDNPNEDNDPNKAREFVKSFFQKLHASYSQLPKKIFTPVEKWISGESILSNIKNLTSETVFNFFAAGRNFHKFSKSFNVFIPQKNLSSIKLNDELQATADKALHYSLEWTLKGTTPERTDLIEYLLQNGANPNSFFEEDHLLSFCYTRPYLAELLLKYGAKSEFCFLNQVPCLIFAAFNKNYDFFNLLLKYGADLNQVIFHGERALVYCMDKDNVEFDEVKLLLQNGANPNTFTASGSHILNFTFYRPDLLDLFLEYGAQPKLCFNMEMPCLISAIRCGNLNFVSTLLKHKVDPNRDVFNGFSALDWAMISDHPEVTEVLLEHGAHLNTKTLLRVLYSKSNIFKILLKFQNQLNLSCPHLLTYYCAHGTKEAVEFLLDQGIPKADHLNEPLFISTRFKKTEIVEVLLNHGANPNNTSSGIPIVEAFFNNDIPTLRILLEKGAHTNIILSGISLLSTAALIKGAEDILELLLESGTEQDAFFRQINLPLKNAAFANNLEEVRFHLLAGADPKPIFSYVCKYDINPLIIELFLEYGADVNSPAPNGSFPLHYAVQNKCLDTITVLLHAGADINQKGEGDHTPLYFACNLKIENSDLSVIELLLHNGANPNIAGDNGLTPLKAAEQKNLTNIKNLLAAHKVE